MGDGIERARHRHGNRQARDQFGIVKYRVRAQAGVAHGCLDAILGLTENWRAFAAGVGGGKCDLAKAMTQCQCLSKTDRRTAPGRQHAIGAHRLQVFFGLVSHVCRGVHRCAGEHSDRIVSEVFGQIPSKVRLLRSRQHENPIDSQGLEVVRDPAADSGAKQYRLSG